MPFTKPKGPCIKILIPPGTSVPHSFASPSLSPPQLHLSLFPQPSTCLPPFHVTFQPRGIHNIDSRVAVPAANTNLLGT